MNKDSNKRKRLRQASLGVLSAAAVFASLGMTTPKTVHAADINSSMIKYLGNKKVDNELSKPSKMITGYITQNTIHGTPFGGSTKSWEHAQVGEHRYNAYRYHKKEGDKGKVGMLYPNAVTYHDLKTGKKTKLTVRLTWMGGTDLTNNPSDPSDKIIFHPDAISANFYGNTDNDLVNVSYYTDKAGTVPFQKTKTVMSFWDIDAGQAIGFPQGKSEYGNVYYRGTDAKHKTSKIMSTDKDTYGGTGQENSISAGEGSVYADDPDGVVQIVTAPVNSMNFSYSHGNTRKYNGATPALKPGTTHTSIARKSKVSIPSPGNYFHIKYNTAQLLGYEIPVDKFVSKTAKGPFTQRKLNGYVQAGKSLYFDVRTRLLWPSARFTKSGNHNADFNALPNSKHELVISDNVDKSLKVKSVKIYATDKPSEKLTNSKKAKKGYFTITHKKTKTGTEYKATMTKKGAAANSSAWYKYYHMVIETVPQKQSNAEKLDDSHGWYTVNNIGKVNGKSSKKIVVPVEQDLNEELKTKPAPPSASGSGKKEVYFIDDDKSQNLDINDQEEKNGKKIYPGQWVYYRVKFKLKKTEYNDHIHQQYNDLKITDKLDSNLDSSSVSDVKIGTEKADLAKHNVSGKDTLTVNLSPKEDSNLYSKMKHGGSIWLQYRVRVKDSKDIQGYEPDNKIIIKNKATLTGETKYKALEEVTQLSTHRYEITTYDIDENGKVTSSTSGPYYTHDEIPSSSWSSWQSQKLKEPVETNLTKNPLGYTEQPNVDKAALTASGVPLKFVTTAQSSDISTASNDEAKVWAVTTTVPDLHKTTGSRFTSLTLKDTVDAGEVFDRNMQWTGDDGQTYTGIHVFRSDGTDVTREGELKYNPNNKQVEWIASEDYRNKMPLNGESYTMFIPGKISFDESHEARSKTQTGTVDGYNQTKEEAIKDTATVHENTDVHSNPNDKDKNDATTTWTVDPDGLNYPDTSVNKKLTTYKDVQTGEVTTVNDDGSDHTTNSHMNPQHDYIVHYHLTADLGSDHNMRNFNISDPLPENSTLDKNSIHINQDGGEHNWSNTSTDDTLKLKYNGSGKALEGKEVSVDYDIKVKANSDWSNYYNSQTRSGEGKMHYGNNANIVTDDSYLIIPNTAHFNFNDGNSLSSRANFNVGVQMFKTHQYIVQDDDKFNGAEKLDPSHYVNNTRNDKTAVTTAVKVQLPNYLKLDNLKANNTFANGNFDKGKTSWEKASDDMVRNPKELANLDLSSTTHNLPTNLQEASGKTYYYYTKWSPKTKFYRDYAALKNMTADFNGSATLSAHSLGQRKDETTDGESRPLGYDKITNEEKKANSTQVHLPNIYSYRSLSDRAMQQEDGQKLDYTLYGQVEGLAVDSAHKTDFSKEGQPVKAWIQPQQGKFEGGKPNDYIRN